jgi:hypothetical protein
MANDLVIPPAFGNAAALARLDPNWNTQQSEFSGGIRKGFAVISLRGKVWRITHQGVERVVTRMDGSNDPASTLNVVLIAAGSDLAKVYYAGGYQDGSNDAPDCFSNDGIKPDRGSTTPQATACAMCPHNVWGSKTTENGKPTKACSDSKRLAVLPLPNDALKGDDALDALDNEMFGGPMLLRVPAASLVDLAQCDATLRAAGIPLYAAGLGLSFDLNAPYPKIVFKPIRPLTEAEFEVVLEHRTSDQTREIIGGFGSGGAADAAAPVAPVAPQPDPNAAAAAQAAAQAKAQAEAAAAQAAAQAKAQAEAAAAQAAMQAATQAAAQNAQAPAPTGGRRARRGGAAPVAATPVAGMAAPEPAAAAPVTAPQPAAAAPVAATAGDIDDVLDGLLNT